MRAIDPRLLRRARSSSGFLLLCVVIGLAIAACVLGQAVTLAIAISRVFLGGADFHDITMLLVLLAGLTVTRAALAYLQETAAARASAVVKSQLRRRPDAPRARRRSIVAFRTPHRRDHATRHPRGGMHLIHTSRATCRRWC